MKTEKRKRHHYVPKSYLRFFSKDGVSIRLFHIKKRKFIESASIKEQMAESYFYGTEPEIENSFVPIEGRVKEILQAVNNGGDVEIKDNLDLIFFVSLQMSRTLTSAEKLNASTDFMTKAVLKPKFDEAGISPDSFTIGYDNPALFQLAINFDIWPLLLDLDWVVIENNSGVPFFTSDNPVALHNQYYEDEDFFGTIGYATKGLQIFFPISPHTLLLWYDSDVYEIGAKRNPARVKLHQENDILEINSLQYLNANEVLVVQDKHQDDYMERIGRINNFVPVRNRPDLSIQPEDDGSALLRNSNKSVKSSLKVSQIRTTSKPKIEPRRGIPKVRDPFKVKQLESFLEMKKSGRTEFKHFMDYLAYGSR